MAPRIVDVVTSPFGEVEEFEGVADCVLVGCDVFRNGVESPFS